MLSQVYTGDVDRGRDRMMPWVREGQWNMAAKHGEDGLPTDNLDEACTIKLTFHIPLLLLGPQL